MSIGPNCSWRSATLLLRVQNLAQGAAEDVRLRVLSYAARFEHLPVAIDFAVELLDLAAEDIRPEDYLFKGAGTALRSMGAHHVRPPEDRFEYLEILLQLDERRAGQVEIQV